MPSIIGIAGTSNSEKSLSFVKALKSDYSNVSLNLITGQRGSYFHLSFLIRVRHDFNDVYFEIASVIQLEILRRLANFTFHENYLSSQSTFGQSYIVIFAK